MNRKRVTLIAFILLFSVPLFFVYRSKTQHSPPQGSVTFIYDKAERDAFVESVTSLNKARDLSNKNVGLLGTSKTPEEESEIFLLTEKGINLSYSVSGGFLTSLHPQLEVMYKDKLVYGSMLWLEGAKDSHAVEGVKKQVDGVYLQSEWIKWFDKNGDSFVDKIF